MSEAIAAPRADRAVFGVVFLMVFAFSYSEPVVSQLFPSTNSGRELAWRIAVIVVDAVVLIFVGLMKRSITRADGDAPRLWGWWWTGVAILIGIDAFRLISLESIRLDVATATVYAAAMGFTMAASLNADPLTLINTERRLMLPVDWSRVRAIVPLVIGTWLCYLAATAYIDLFDIDTIRTLDPALESEIAELSESEQIAVIAELCSGAISPTFFQLVAEVIPVLLLALGVEFNYFRRTLIDAGQRAATAATVTVLAAALVATLSTLPWDGQGCGDVLSRWHEYIAFLLTVQGIFTGLATLVWLLVASTPDGPPGADEPAEAARSVEE
ncbi:hypothetical protein BST36_00180 [Mycolicibacterium moriokaense]|uniref:Uncharacterized protein n=1 Tax=Mycolicibacterium moriokaense TaxID=39691 RepID=A0AAD1M5Y5_9MYCO|nr:hypothetical protein [Mycolicibacterium moriokaense]MCV7041259.1 hypothetical protein [Mycolicibacterium moriokaense]ORB27144.1 hypothetical protein BST36_00180 [Mycolicibacterium moriokaense]BBX00825.1 hypothetical protein MMOR_17610 [Mycolicibacterium moriokaense]